NMRSLSQNSTLTSTCSILHFFTPQPTPTPIYSLSLHDALPISLRQRPHGLVTQITRADQQHTATLVNDQAARRELQHRPRLLLRDRKSTRLNSSHQIISYAVFCLKKKIDSP